MQVPILSLNLFKYLEYLIFYSYRIHEIIENSQEPKSTSNQEKAGHEKYIWWLQI